MRIYLKITLLLILSLMIYSCQDNIVSNCEIVIPPEGVRATFQSIQNNIFTPSCAKSGCHSGVNPQQGMSLEAGKAYSNLVGVPSVQSMLNRVEANDSENSWIIKKLSAEGTSFMPPTGQLANATIDTVAAWIDKGALEN